MRGKTRFLRENLGGLSLTLIGVLILGLSAVLYQKHGMFPNFAFAQGKGLDGTDIDLLQRQNQAYERIAKAVTPAIVAIQSTQVVQQQASPFSNDPLFQQFFGRMFPSGSPERARTRAGKRRHCFVRRIHCDQQSRSGQGLGHRGDTFR